MGVEPAVFQSVSQKRAASSGTELFKRGLGNPQQAAFGSRWLSKGIACRFYFKIAMPHKGFVLTSF